MSGNFSGPSFEYVDPDQFFLATSIGLSITADPAEMALPAAVLVFGLETPAKQPGQAQILTSSNCIAALQGAMQAWSRRLPVAARDQYDALVAEAAAKWAEQVDAYLGGGR